MSSNNIGSGHSNFDEGTFSNYLKAISYSSNEDIEIITKSFIDTFRMDENDKANLKVLFKNGNKTIKQMCEKNATIINIQSTLESEQKNNFDKLSAKAQRICKLCLQRLNISIAPIKKVISEWKNQETGSDKDTVFFTYLASA